MSAILVGIAFLLDLLESVAIRDKFHYLEFENVNICAKFNRHINAAVIGSVFNTYIYSQGGKIAIHNGVIALVIGQLVFSVPVVRNGGKKRLQGLL